MKADGSAVKLRKEKYILNITLLGGDRRMSVAATFLTSKGHDVYSSTGDIPADTRLLVLPYPASKDGVCIAGTDIPFFSLTLPASCAVFGGRLPPAWREGKLFADAEENENFLLDNAYLTAAAGVATALRAGERAFFRTTAGVIGYGRIGRSCANMLRALGAEVSVYVRREAARREAENAGFRSHLLAADMHIPSDLIFGTAPAPSPNLVALTVAPSAHVYDLGGGLPDALAAADGSHVKVLPLRGAPGVFAPQAAGEIYGGAVLDFIHLLQRRTTV